MSNTLQEKYMNKYKKKIILISLKYPGVSVKKNLNKITHYHYPLDPHTLAPPPNPEAPSRNSSMKSMGEWTEAVAPDARVADAEATGAATGATETEAVGVDAETFRVVLGDVVTALATFRTLMVFDLFGGTTWEKCWAPSLAGA